MNQRAINGFFGLLVAAGVILVLGVLLALIFGGLAFGKSFSRYQAREDANNRVKVTEIEIRNQQQRVLIAEQQAEIRVKEAHGIRESQDLIAQTLTPMYVQFEMIEALKAVAASGTNNSVVYIPSGEMGVPLVSLAPGAQLP